MLIQLLVTESQYVCGGLSSSSITCLTIDCGVCVVGVINED